MRWGRLILLSSLALALISCAGSGVPKLKEEGGVTQVEDGKNVGEESDGGSVLVAGGEEGPSVNDGDGMSAGPSIQKVLVPLEVFNLPCADMESSPDESEIIVSIPESQIEGCLPESQLFPFSFSLISIAYAQEEPEPKWTYRLQCLRRCRIKENQIEFDIPAGDSLEAEKPLLRFPLLQDWQAILTANLANADDPDKIKLLEKEGEGKLQEEKNRKLFKKKFLKKIRENLDRGKKEGIGEDSSPDEGAKQEEKSHGEIVDKKGLKELGPIDLKADPPSHPLKLRVGQKWESGPMMGPIQYCRFEEGDHFRKVSLQYFNPHAHRTDLSPEITISGLAETVVKIACKIDVHGFGFADLIIDLTVEDPDKSKQEPPWEWSLPEFKQNLLYFGDMPECRMGDGSESYLTQVGGLEKINEEANYQMFLGDGGRWTGGMIGPYRFRRLISSDPEIVSVHFSKKLWQFVIQGKKQGSTLVSWEAVRIQDIDQEVPEEGWKKIQIVATVFPYFETEVERAAGGRLCPGEIRVEQPEEECPVTQPAGKPADSAPQAAPPEPDHTVDPPAALSADETALAAKLYPLFNVGNTPAVCTDAMLRRQSKKLAHCFYQTPTPDYLLASCVTCANNVSGALVDCLSDEKTACFQIKTLGRGNVPILDVPLHAATVVFPVCTTFNDDSIVLDTWFAPGNWIPSLHRHRVFKLKDWKSGKTTDFGLQKEQTNLGK